MAKNNDKGKAEKKSGKKGDKITNSDVKEATNATKNVSINFPSEAPSSENEAFKQEVSPETKESENTTPPPAPSIEPNRQTPFSQQQSKESIIGDVEPDTAPGIMESKNVAETSPTSKQDTDKDPKTENKKVVSEAKEVKEAKDETKNPVTLITPETPAQPAAISEKPSTTVVTENKVPATPIAPTQEELEEQQIEKWWNSRNRPSEINHFELASSSAGINMHKFSAYEAIIGKFRFKRSHAGANWQITVEEKKK